MQGDDLKISVKRITKKSNGNRDAEIIQAVFFVLNHKFKRHAFHLFLINKPFCYGKNCYKAYKIIY